MDQLYSILTDSIPAFSILSLINNILIISSIGLLSTAIFNLNARKQKLIMPIIGIVIILFSAYEIYTKIIVSDTTLSAFLIMLMPFICMSVLFSPKQMWKAYLITIGYNIVEAAKYLILMLFYEYDGRTISAGIELFVDTIVNSAAFVIALAIYISYSKKKQKMNIASKIRLPLFLLIIFTVIVFISTMLVFGLNFTEVKRKVFILALSNIPLFVATVSYALTDILRSRISEENYKKQVEMQLQNYEILEKKNEEMRILRHDLPKKLRPLSTFIAEGKTEEANQILKEFEVSVENTRPRFQTGNFRLDTVLECQQQIAEKDGITIVLPFSCAFPAEGIAPDDIYTIFPNMLDNAIEATRKTEQKEITFTSKILGDTVYITCTNPVIGKINIKNGNPETTKADKSNHGFGFRSIKKAAAKYGKDNVDVKVEDGMFTLRIDLKFK